MYVKTKQTKQNKPSNNVIQKSHLKVKLRWEVRVGIIW